MSLIAGYKGYVQIQGVAGESSEGVLSVATLFRWRLYMNRHMIEVTPHNVDDQRFRPGQGRSYVELEGYLDDAASHPNFNIVGRWKIGLWPNSGDAQYMIFTGWANEIEWLVPVDGMETFRAKVWCDQEPTYYEY